MEEIIRVLNQLRDEGLILDYAIGGGIATLFYTQPFTTVDVDVFAVLRSQTGLVDLSPIYTRLRALGYREDGQYVRIGGSLPMQLLVPPTALEEEAVREADIREVGKEKARVIRPEYLVSIYLAVYRPKDRVRIEALLKSDSINYARLQKLIERYGLEEKWTRYQRDMA
jgi:hypothetical protein